MQNKSDAADAEAICEAVARPSMRFVPVKTPDQQSILVLRWTRHPDLAALHRDRNIK
jgi:transposase